MPEAPAGWTISTTDSGYTCPDGDPALVTVIAPAGEPDAVAVVIPDGSFDYVLEPDLADPLAGAHFQSPSRLDGEWALRQSWAVAGLYTSGDPAVSHSGSLAVALTRRGAAVVIPSLCWGDYGQAQGDASGIEGFRRQGATMVRWTWDTVMADPGALGIAGSAPEERVLVGLGEGGRGAAEVVIKTTNAPTARLGDSADDNLGVYWDDPGAWADRVIGLDRIVPGGPSQAAARSLAGATLPARTALVYSSADPQLPAGAIDALVTRVTQINGMVVDPGEVRHVQTAGDAAVADEVVGFLLGDPADDTDP